LPAAPLSPPLLAAVVVALRAASQFARSPGANAGGQIAGEKKPQAKARRGGR